MIDLALKHIRFVQGAAMSALAQGLGAVGSALFQHHLNRMDVEESRDYMSPKMQASRLIEGGFNPARSLSQGAILSNQGQDIAPTDISASMASVSGVANAALQQKLADAQVDNINADTDMKRSQTGLNDFDLEFKKLALDGNLSLLNSSVAEKLKGIELSDAQIKNLSAEYQKLSKEVEQIDANIDVLKQNALKMSEETALLKLEQSIKQQLADSQVLVNQAQISLMAKQGYAAVMSGKTSELQNTILGIQAKFAHTNEFNKASSLASKASKDASLAGIAENEKTVSDAVTSVQAALAPATALTTSLQQVFGLGAGAAGKALSLAASALK